MGSRGLVLRNDRSDSIDVPGFPSPNIIVTNYFNDYKEDGKFTKYQCM